MDVDESKDREAKAGAGPITLEWGMSLILTIEGVSGTHRCAVVGMERGEYLICNTPPVPGLWAKLHVHNGVTVRYVHKGTIYGFRCTLTALLDKPFRFMILSYPDNIEAVKLRKEERTMCLAPAMVKGDHAACKGLIRDISVAGCGVAFSDSPEGYLSDLKLPVDATLTTRLLGSEMQVGIEVVNVRKHRGKVILGSRFRDPASDTVETIKGFIETIADLDGPHP